MKKYFSFPLFKENIKRFWGFSAVAFVAYFLSNSFEILLDYDVLDVIEYRVNRMIDPSYFPYGLFGVAVAVIASVLVFRYLTKVNSTGVTHAMPFSRASLFITNYISGFVLAIIPVILNSILLCIISKPVIYEDCNIFTVNAVLLMCLCNILVIFFSYSISVLAGIISGNSIIHLLTAAALNFIMPLIFSSFESYKELFYYGYDYNDDGIWNVISVMHPVIKLLGESVRAPYDTVLGLGNILIYILVALAISALAYYLYSVRKLERAGDSYVFGWVKYVIAACFTYFAATMMGLMLEDRNLLLGLVIGAVIGFAVGWMIISKSFRIFNMKALRAFGISAGVTVLIVLAFALDLAGYEKRVPEISEISSIDFEAYASDCFDINDMQDPENFANVIELHKYLIENRENGQGENNWSNISIVYHLNDGSVVSRYYRYMGYDEIRNSVVLKAIYDSDENDGSASALMDLLDENTVINFDAYRYDSDGGYIGSEETKSLYRGENYQAKEEILTALVKDISERSFEEYLDGSFFSDEIGNLQIFTPEHDQAKDIGYVQSYNEGYYGKDSYVWEAYIDVCKDFKNTIKALEKYNML